MDLEEEAGASDKTQRAGAFKAAFSIWSGTDDNDPPQVEQDKVSVLTAEIKPESNHLQSTPPTEGSLIIPEASDIKTPDDADNSGLPLSIQNLTLSTAKVEEEEQQRIMSNEDESYLLSSWDLQDIAFEERMRAWVDNADTEQRTTKETHENSQQEGDNHAQELETQSLAKSSLKESQASQAKATDNESVDSYLVQRSLREKVAEERISAVVSQAGSDRIRPEDVLLLRHATHLDAGQLITIYNSYVRGTVQCLDTTPITVDDMCKLVDESRKEELPFIVAMNVDKRKPWGKMMGFVRLTNFLDGNPSVSGTARLEIMVGLHNRGQNVGRCLMDAMMAFADPENPSKGGYHFVSNRTELNELTISSSTSCRPLSHLVIQMNYSEAEASRYRRIGKWLKREHGFSEKGNLPSVARKMAQKVNIALLVREILPRYTYDSAEDKW